MNSALELEFLKSAIKQDSNILLNTKITSCFENCRKTARVIVEQVPLNLMQKWSRNSQTGNIIHDSGKFFTIKGIQVNTNWGSIPQWSQPIINQPEIGYLGFIVKKFDGVLHFLVQFKIEPGNINMVQISPTLQATKSNYSQVHNGKKPRFLEYFNGIKPVNILLDQLQSEHNARFLRKRNRNMIVEIFEDLKIDTDFAWLTLGQIKRLMQEDNIINMNTRSVLSGIIFNTNCNNTRKAMLETSSNISHRAMLMLESVLCIRKAFNSFENILSWITCLKSKYTLIVDSIPINQITDWYELEGVLCRKDKKHFSVIGVQVTIEGREVTNWYQPIIKPTQEGLSAFIIKMINGVYHFLVQAKIEAGNFDIIELAPTVQCLVDNYKDDSVYNIPYLDEIMSAQKKSVYIDTMQSEEGGRFFKEQNRNMIVEVNEEFSNIVLENYCWMTLDQISRLIKFNNFFNISARSLISAIQFV